MYIHLYIYTYMYIYIYTHFALYTPCYIIAGNHPQTAASFSYFQTDTMRPPVISWFINHQSIRNHGFQSDSYSYNINHSCSF